jgi:hypothetical protein
MVIILFVGRLPQLGWIDYLVQTGIQRHDLIQIHKEGYDGSISVHGK